MSRRWQRAVTGVLAVLLCALGAVTGWVALRPADVEADKVTKVDGMIFWGTSGLNQMYTLIKDEKYADDADRAVSLEVGQHEWVGLGREKIGYGAFNDGSYGSAAGGSYAVLQDWYDGWTPGGDDLVVAGGAPQGQYWQFQDATDDNPYREPTLASGNAGADMGGAIMSVLDQVTSSGHVNPVDGTTTVWGEDDEDKGGNGNDKPGDGIAIVIWAGEDWVVRNWDSSDLGFVGQEDGQKSSTMDDYSTNAVLLKYWMGLNGESSGNGMGTHEYNPAPWANKVDDGSVMHQGTRDNGLSADENSGAQWNDGVFTHGDADEGKKDLLEGGENLNGHLGDQEVAVTTCNDALYPNLDKTPRLNDTVKTGGSNGLLKGTDDKGSSPGLVRTPYTSGDDEYAYYKESDGGTKTVPGTSSQSEYTSQAAGNSYQVSDHYTTQWVEKDNGYQDYKNSGFSYNGVDDGINVDLSVHKLAETTDAIGDGYADGKKSSLATQCGTLFARVLSGYDYEVEYLVQDQDASAIPHNTDDTQLDDWYEITYLNVQTNECSHNWLSCECGEHGLHHQMYKVCSQDAGYTVSVQRIRVRSRCDTKTPDKTGTPEKQADGQADTGYADSYHIHVLGGVGMYDKFPITAEPWDPDGLAKQQSAENCGTPASGFTGDYEEREDCEYDPSSTVSVADSTGHNCWEHIPMRYSAVDDSIACAGCGAWAPGEVKHPYSPQKVLDEVEVHADYCDSEAWFWGGDPKDFDLCSTHADLTGDFTTVPDDCLHRSWAHGSEEYDSDGDGVNDSVRPALCNCNRSLPLSSLCPYLRVMPVTEVAGFLDPKTGDTLHDVIPREVIDWNGAHVNLNSYGLQAGDVGYAAMAQRFLRTWGNDDGTPKYVDYIGDSVKQRYSSSGSVYPYGMIKYGSAQNPPENDPAVQQNAIGVQGSYTDPDSVSAQGTQYQEGSNYVNHDDDSHVYIRTWYTNPNKPIMKYVTETRHVNGYIESWLDKYPDAKVYVFGLGPYSKAATEDTKDEVWTSDRNVTDANYWTDEFGRDTNFDGRINGMDRVQTNNKDTESVDATHVGPGLTELSMTARDGYYTDTEGLHGSTEDTATRNEAIRNAYLVGEPYYYDGGTKVDTVPVVTDDAAKQKLMDSLSITESEAQALLADTSKYRRAGDDLFHEDGSWLDLADYGGTVPEANKYIDEIARTERIDAARQEYNEALKAGLKNATFVDIWDLVLEHNPYFQYASTVDSAAVGTGAGDAVNAYHGKYYDQTTYSWIFHMMWATVLNDNPEDEPDEVVSANLYDLASALTAYANTVLSPKGRSNTGGGDAAASATDAGSDAHRLPDLTKAGFFGAGAALGYGDSGYGFTSSLLVPLSNSSSTVDYKSLINAELGPEGAGDKDNSAMYVYARYGRLLQDMGLDETAMQFSVSPRTVPGLLTAVGYVGNAALGVVWNTAFQVLDVMNPFRFLIGTAGHSSSLETATGTIVDGGLDGGVGVTDPWNGGTGHGNVSTATGAVAPGVSGLSNEDGKVPNALKPIINYCTDIYLVLRGIGTWIVLPLLLALFFASVLLLRKRWTQAAPKFLVPFVFIIVGVPMLGIMYTAVLDGCRELANMSSSPSSKLVAATFVDFQGWVETERLAPPAIPSDAGSGTFEFVSEGGSGSGVNIGGNASSDSGHASSNTLSQLRKIAWAINRTTGVVPSVATGTDPLGYAAYGGALENQDAWDELVIRSDTKSYGAASNWKEQWKDAMAASSEIMGLIWQYMNGDFYLASDFNSATMSHFSRNYPELIGSRRGGGAVTDSGSSTDRLVEEGTDTELATSAAEYDEADNKGKLYGLFASASHGDAWLNRSAEENEMLLTGADIAIDGATTATSENFTGFNPFANGRISASATSVPIDGGSTITYRRDLVATPNASSPGDGLDWKHNGGLSTVAMYNYLVTDFDSSAVKTYSTSKVLNLHQEMAHYAVNTIGSGFTGTMYWLNCVVFMLACCVVGFVYALGMVITNIKNGFQMIMGLPAAMMGLTKSIATTCVVVISMIFQIISSVVLYQIVAEVLMALVTIVDGVARDKFAGVTFGSGVGGMLAQAAPLPADVQGSFASCLFYMMGSVALMALFTAFAVKLAPAFLRVSDMAFDWILARWLVPEGALAGYLAAKAERRAAAGARRVRRVRGRVRSGKPVPVENTACEMAADGL